MDLRLLGAFVFLTFLLSQTRGAFLGLLAGIFMVLIFLIFKARKKLKVTAAVILLFFIMAGGLFIVFRHSPFIKNLPIVGRFADIFYNPERRVFGPREALSKG